MTTGSHAGSKTGLKTGLKTGSKTGSGTAPEAAPARVALPILPPALFGVLLGTLLGTLLGVLTGAASAQGADGAVGPLPPGPGAELVYAKCQQCHPLRYVTESAGLPPFLWQDTVDLMVQLGMQATDEELERMVVYLSTHLGPTPPPSPTTEGGSEGGSEGSVGAGGATDPAGGAEGADDTGGDASDAAASGPAAVAAAVDGAAVYAASCAGCHGAEGAGVPGAFPPLAGHAAALAAADRDHLPRVVLYGLQGEIRVEGQRYAGVMPAWAHLSDAEIAALLDHLLGLGGAGDEPDAAAPAPYTAAEVAALRAQPLTAKQVLERRPALDGE